MSRTVIDLDDGLLSDVARALGTSTREETVNTALREVLEARRAPVGSAPGSTVMKWRPWHRSREYGGYE